MAISKKFTMLLLTMLLTLSMTFNSFAVGISDVSAKIKQCPDAGVSNETVISIITKHGGSTDSFNATTTGAEQLVFVDIDGKKYYFSNGKCDAIFKDLDEAVLKGAEAINSNKTSVDDAKDKINEGLGDLLEPADITGGANALSGFKDIVSLLMGIAAYGAILGMSLFTCCDILYLTIPFLHAKMNDAGSSGGKMASQSSESGSGTKFALVTDDAIWAYNTAQEQQKQPWVLYLKRRIVAIIMLTLVIFILLTGEISIILDLALKLTSGIIDELVKLAQF